jgi:hypothetical protein
MFVIFECKVERSFTRASFLGVPVGVLGNPLARNSRVRAVFESSNSFMA